MQYTLPKSIVDRLAEEYDFTFDGTDNPFPIGITIDASGMTVKGSAAAMCEFLFMLGHVVGSAEPTPDSLNDLIDATENATMTLAQVGYDSPIEPNLRLPKFTVEA